MLVPTNLFLLGFVPFQYIRAARMTDSTLQVALNTLHITEVEADAEPRIRLIGTDIH